MFSNTCCKNGHKMGSVQLLHTLQRSSLAAELTIPSLNMCISVCNTRKGRSPSTSVIICLIVKPALVPAVSLDGPFIAAAHGDAPRSVHSYSL